MDPSIMKLLEDDEDESMHSGADLEAFTAALNRDLGRDDPGTSQPPDSVPGILSKENSCTSSQLHGEWQNPSHEANPIQPNMNQAEQHHLQIQEKHQSQVSQIRQQSDVANMDQEISNPQGQEQSHAEQHEHAQQGGKLTEADNAKVVEKEQVNYTETNPVLSQEESNIQKSDNQQQHPIKQFSNQQTQSSDQANNPMRRTKFSSISFYALIPVLRPHLDKDRYMQLNDVFSKLKSNEISRDDFLRVIRNTVGDQMLRQAVHKVMQQQGQALAARNSQVTQNQHQAPAQASLQHIPVRNTQPPDHHSFSQVRPVSSQHQIGQRSLSGQSQVPAPTVQMQNDASSHSTENSSWNSKVMESPSDKGINTTETSSNNMFPVKQERDSSLHALNKQQSLSQVPPKSFTMHGGTMGSYITHQFPRPNTSDSANSSKSQTQGVLSSQSGVTQPINLTNMPKYEPQIAVSENKRLQGSSLSNYPSHPSLHENKLAWQPSSHKEQRGSGSSSMGFVKQEIVDHGSQPQSGPLVLTPQSSSLAAINVDQVSSASSFPKDDQADKRSSMVFITPTSTTAAAHMTSSIASPQEQAIQIRSQTHSTSSSALAGPNTKPPTKKPSVGQKKPLEAQGTPPSHLASKKQKVSGTFHDQSIEQLNDVTAVSGVNLREEEEQLLTSPKEESRASEAVRKAVQEEEERLIVQKQPLQKKLGEIMSKCGIENFGSDVERCLSMCVEERLRGLISNVIRISKQRVDCEKPRHRIVFTSDVRREVLSINRKAKEELERKQAEEAEKHRKHEIEVNVATDAEKDKDEGRSKTLKVNKDEDDKMRTTAANVAARAAVGGDDMLSKWQLMAEQARQKREGGGLEGTPASQPGKTAVRKPNSGKTSKDNHGDKKSAAAALGSMRKFGRSPVNMPHLKVAHSISIKDVIAVLQREPQMSKSTLLYRLFERISSDPEE